MLSESVHLQACILTHFHRAEVAHLTSGISGNMYKKYASQELALDAYEAAFNCGAIKRVR